MQHEFPKRQSFEQTLAKAVQQLNYMLHIGSSARVFPIASTFALPVVELLRNAGYNAEYDSAYDYIDIFNQVTCGPNNAVEYLVYREQMPTDVIIPRAKLMMASESAFDLYDAHILGVSNHRFEGFEPHPLANTVFQQTNTQVLPLYTELNRMLCQTADFRSCEALLEFDLHWFHIQQNLDALTRAGYTIQKTHHSISNWLLTVVVQFQPAKALVEWDFHQYHTEVVPADTRLSNAKALGLLTSIAHEIECRPWVSTVTVYTQLRDFPVVLKTIEDAGYTVDSSGKTVVLNEP